MARSPAGAFGVRTSVTERTIGRTGSGGVNPMPPRSICSSSQHNIFAPIWTPRHELSRLRRIIVADEVPA